MNLKRFVKISLIGMTSTVAIAAISLSYLGLDNDAADSFDSTLETQQPDEEVGFGMVADVIRGFVNQQYRIRTSAKNLEKYQDETNTQKPGEYSTVYKDLPGQTAYATRDVHRKTHGCFVAKLKVDDQLLTNVNSTVAKIRSDRQNEPSAQGPWPEALKDKNDLGVFQPGQEYDAVVRYSNGHPLNRPDNQADARGFAVKLLANGSFDSAKSLQNQDLSKLNSNTVLDILSINFPTFFVNPQKTAAKYTELNQFFLAGAHDFSNPLTDKLQETRSIFTTGINAMEIRQALWVNGSIIYSPLYQEYFSMVPSRLGSAGSARAVKYFWKPEACAGVDAAAFDTEQATQWPAWAKEHKYAAPEATVSMLSTPPHRLWDKDEYPRDYLRAHAGERLAKGDFCYGLYFQVYRDQLSTNVEDSTDLWLRSEVDRQNWVQNVIPSEDNLFWSIYGGKRETYVEKIISKKIVEPVRAGTLTIAKTDSKESASNSKMCEDLSFNPWNGNIDYHKPLGVISRLKRRVYDASRRARHFLNGFKQGSFERQEEK